MSNVMGGRSYEVTPLDLVHRLILFGEPNSEIAERKLAEWSDYFRELRLDPTVSTVRFFLEALLSATSHIAWRATRGPATPVAPGVLVVICGVFAFSYAASDTYALTSPAVWSGVAGIVAGCLLTAEARQTERGALIRWLWALVALSMFITALSHAFDPVVSSDWIAVIGYVVAAACLSPMFLSSTRQRHAWKPWLGIALATITLALSNLVGMYQFIDPAAQRSALLTFAGELAAGIALLHWVRSRRTASLPKFGTAK